MKQVERVFDTIPMREREREELSATIDYISNTFESYGKGSLCMIVSKGFQLSSYWNKRF